MAARTPSLPSAALPLPSGRTPASCLPGPSSKPSFRSTAAHSNGRVLLDKAAHPRDRQSASHLCVSFLLHLSQRLQGRCGSGSCAGAVPPGARGLMLIGPSLCPSSLAGGGAYADRKWGRRHWLRSRRCQRLSVRRLAGAWWAPKSTGFPGLGHVGSWFLSLSLPLLSADSGRGLRRSHGRAGCLSPLPWLGRPRWCRPQPGARLPERAAACSSSGPRKTLAPAVPTAGKTGRGAAVALSWRGPCAPAGASIARRRTRTGLMAETPSRLPARPSLSPGRWWPACLRPCGLLSPTGRSAMWRDG